MNLVGSTSLEEIEVHIQDSLAVAAAVPRDALLVDLGSGAGFPGIPIALSRPDVRVTLVEVRERRVSFLRHVARLVSPSFEVLRARIEDGPGVPFDIATLRAVAPPEEAVPLGAAWVRPEGEVWVWTTIDPRVLPWPHEDRIELPERGAVLRFHAAAVSRGTPQSGS